MHFDPKTARVSVDCGRCLRARYRDMGEVCTLVLFICYVVKKLHDIVYFVAPVNYCTRLFPANAKFKSAKTMCYGVLEGIMIFIIVKEHFQ